MLSKFELIFMLFLSLMLFIKAGVLCPSMLFPFLYYFHQSQFSCLIANYTTLFQRYTSIVIIDCGDSLKSILGKWIGVFCLLFPSPASFSNSKSITLCVIVIISFLLLYKIRIFIITVYYTIFLHCLSIYITKLMRFKPLLI